jgi:hypothetical protein
MFLRLFAALFAALSLISFPGLVAAQSEPPLAGEWSCPMTIVNVQSSSVREVKMAITANQAGGHTVTFQIGDGRFAKGWSTEVNQPWDGQKKLVFTGKDGARITLHPVSTDGGLEIDYLINPITGNCKAARSTSAAARAATS